MNRRGALKYISAACVGSAFGLRAEDSPRIKAGFLGALHSHALEKYRTTKELPEFDLVGVCEEEAKAREALGKIGARFITREQLFGEAEVIIVESAVRDHARDAKAALSVGKHVHVEKPPATTMRELQELLRLAKEKNRLLQVGYMWRHNPAFNKAFEAAKNGWLGDVFLFRATMNTQIDSKRRPEWAEFNGGAMFEQGCHLIDAAVRLLGQPIKVTPHLQRRGGDSLADNCIAILEFQKAQAIITNSVLHPNAGPHRYLEILGTNGVARVQPLEPPSLTIDLASPAGPYKKGPQTTDFPNYKRYAGEFQELANAIRNKQNLQVTAPIELAIQETLLRASEMFD